MMLCLLVSLVPLVPFPSQQRNPSQDAMLRPFRRKFALHQTDLSHCTFPREIYSSALQVLANLSSYACLSFPDLPNGQVGMERPLFVSLRPLLRRCFNFSLQRL